MKYKNILTGLLWPEDIEVMHRRGLSEAEYRSEKFLRIARIDLSKSKGDIESFGRVYSELMEAAYAAGYDSLQRPLENLKSDLWSSYEPLDNLFRSKARPDSQPQANPHIIPKRHSIKLIATSLKAVWLFIDSNIISAIISGLVVGLTILYVTDSEKVVGFVDNVVLWCRNLVN